MCNNMLQKDQKKLVRFIQCTDEADENLSE